MNQRIPRFMKLPTGAKSLWTSLKRLRLIAMVGLLAFGAAATLVGLLAPSPIHASGPRSLAGRVIDFQDQPVRGAAITVYLNGAKTPAASGKTQANGTFVLDLPDSGINSLHLEIERPHFRTTTGMLRPTICAVCKRATPYACPTSRWSGDSPWASGLPPSPL